MFFHLHNEWFVLVRSDSDEVTMSDFRLDVEATLLEKAFTGEYNSVSYFTAIVRAPFQKWPVSDHVLSGFLNLEPSLYHIRSFFLKAQDV